MSARPDGPPLAAAPAMIGDLRLRAPPDAKARPKCGRPVWVYARDGTFTGTTDCSQDLGHSGDHESWMYRWAEGVQRITGWGRIRSAVHDVRRRT